VAVALWNRGVVALVVVVGGGCIVCVLLFTCPACAVKANNTAAIVKGRRFMAFPSSRPSPGLWSSKCWAEIGPVPKYLIDQFIPAPCFCDLAVVLHCGLVMRLNQSVRHVGGFFLSSAQSRTASVGTTQGIVSRCRESDLAADTDVVDQGSA
jgi:hypothetical protein